MMMRGGEQQPAWRIFACKPLCLRCCVLQRHRSRRFAHRSQRGRRSRNKGKRIGMPLGGETRHCVASDWPVRTGNPSGCWCLSCLISYCMCERSSDVGCTHAGPRPAEPTSRYDSECDAMSIPPWKRGDRTQDDRTARDLISAANPDTIYRYLCYLSSLRCLVLPRARYRLCTGN